MTDGTSEPASRAVGGEVHDNEFHGPSPIQTGTGDQNNTFNNFAVAAPERRRDILAGLPPEPAGFVGRGTEVDQLLEVLRPGSSDGAVLVCAVGGLAGIGKSALAIHAARRAVAEGWFHGGLWMNLRGFDAQASPVAAAGAVPGLLRALGWDDDLPASAPEQFALYHTVLTGLAQQGQRVLVVLDNVADVMQIDELLPRHEVHRVVVTSRAALSSLDARMLDLDVLGAADAVALLAKALRDAHPDDSRTADQSALAALAEMCGRLPLALQIAAALLKASPKRPVASLTRRLADERARLETLQFPDSALRPGVRAALHLSYERLSEPVQWILRLLSIDPGPDIATATIAALTDLSGDQAQEQLYVLERARLIACDEHERWSTHDLVRLYARELLEAHPEEHAWALDRLLAYYLATAAAADDHMNALPGRPVSEAFSGRSQALAWFDANRANLIAAVHLAADSGHREATMYLPSVLVSYFQWRRLFVEWIQTHTAAVGAARTLKDRVGEGMVLNNLGLALREVRRFEEAIDAHQQAAAIFRETGNRHREGMVLNNLGLALRAVRRFEEAIDAHQQAAAIYRETGNRHREGTALNNLGNALLEVRRFEEAIDAHQQAAAIYRETGDRHGEGMALNNLGLALRGVRRFEEAVDAHQQAAAIFRETGDRHGEGMALDNLGLALQGVRRFEEAIDAYQQAAAIYRETGDRHGEGMALNNLGLALQGVRRFEEAIDVGQQAAVIFRETGDRHREGIALDNLGLALQGVRRFEEAVDAHQQAAAIYRETGDRHREGLALDNLRDAQNDGQRPA